MSYAAGQQVAYAKMDKPATIISGPHTSFAKDRYLITKADGNVSLVPSAELSPITTQREKVASALWYKLTGTRTAWADVPTGSRRIYFEMADVALAAAGVDKPEPRPLAVGDRIRITRDRLSNALVCRGDELTILSIDERCVETNAPRSVVQRKWRFLLALEDDGWERI